MMMMMMTTNMFNVLEVEKPNRSLGSQAAEAEQDYFHDHQKDQTFPPKKIPLKVIIMMVRPDCYDIGADDDDDNDDDKNDDDYNGDDDDDDDG